jgi:hypothetical protein
MKRKLIIVCALAIVSATVWAQQPPPAESPGHSPGAAKHPSKKKESQKGGKAQELPAQTMPPVPATLMNSAPVKPSVVMESGMLTIDAPNSTLSDVLNGVHNVTGAVIEGASPTERIAVKIGPGTPEQVIAALLRGTPYDYVILGTFGKRDAVARVLLTQQQPQSFQPTPEATNRPGQPDESLPERTPPDEMSPRGPENSDTDQAQQPEPQPQPPQPEPQGQQAPQQQPGQQQQGQQQQPQDPNAPKTPEQLFRELQQLEQQKQQSR